MSTQALVKGISSTMGDDYPLNLKLIMDCGITQQPNSKIITRISDTIFHEITYKEIQLKSTKLASSLSKYIKPGDIVSSFMWNTARHMMLYYTIPNMGICLNPLNLRLHPKELAYILSHSQPKIIFIDANMLNAFEKINKNALKSVKMFVICGNNMKSFGWNTILPNSIDFDVLLNQGSTYFNWPMVDEKSGCFLNYTSGTTGNPKGIVQSHRSAVLTILTLPFDKYVKGSSCVLGLPPMFHACGWSIELAAFMKGHRMLLPYNCYDFPKLMEWSLRENVDFMAGVPTMIAGLVSAMKANKEKFKPFYNRLTFGTGGTAIPPHLVKWLYDTFKVKVIHIFGMTECFPGACSELFSRRDDIDKSNEQRIKNIIPQGYFAPIVVSKLIDPDTGKPLSKDGKNIGEVLVRGPCVTRAYFKGEGKNKFDQDGYLFTGDIAKITSTNQMTITDRSKDLIKSGGEWISSVDIENYIAKLPEIEYACVVAQPHPKWVERPVCIIQLKQGKTLTKEFVLNFAKKKFAKFQIPDDILFWNEIPMTGTGKLSKKDVRKKLKDQGYKLPSLIKQAKL